MAFEAQKQNGKLGYGEELPLVIKADKRLKLHGFNNLTKTLSFNIYDICYTSNEEDGKGYIEYIDEQYNAQRLTDILTNVSKIIGANILNIAQQDYEPQGASVTMLISEEPIYKDELEKLKSESPGPLPNGVVAHLDKSHIAVHTYRKAIPKGSIPSVRILMCPPVGISPH